MSKQDWKKIENGMKSFPKFQLNKVRQDEIHDYLMNECNKLDTKNKKKRFVKKVVIPATSIIAFILFAIITSSYFVTDQVKHHAEKQIINQPNEMEFNNIIKGEFDMIKVKTEVDLDTAVFMTKELELIRLFKQAMYPMRFSKMNDKPDLFKAEKIYELTSEDNLEIQTIIMTKENSMSINGIWYEIKGETSILDAFENELLVERFRVDIEDLLVNRAKEIVTALSTKNAGVLAQFVHSSKGLLFSPYITVNEDAVVFKHSEVANLFNDMTKYEWGTFNGRGNAIRLSPNEYYDQFIFDHNFLKAEEIIFNPEQPRGIMKNNIKNVFPNANIVQFYFPIKENGETFDWSSLNLVFQLEDNRQWKLVAIVHSERTI